MTGSFIRPYQGLLFFLGSVIITIILVVFVLLPKIDEIKTLRATIEQQKIQRDELQTYASYLEELANTTLEIEEDLVHYALPSENDVISLIVTYEGLSKTENITVSPFGFSPGLVRKNKKNAAKAAVPTPAAAASTPGTEENTTPPAGPKTEELPFTMDIETEDQQVALDFIKSIYKTRRVFNIKSLKWENPKEATDKTINIGFSLVTYFYQTPPLGLSSPELVKKGKTQTEFIQQLRDTMVYEDLVLDGVLVGKEDLFRMGEDVKKEIQQKKESSPSAVIAEPLTIF